MGRPLHNFQQKSWWVRSGHRAMTSYKIQPSTELSTRSGFRQLSMSTTDWNGGIIHNVGQKMNTPDLWHCILIFGRSFEVINLGWHILTYSGWIEGFDGFLRPCDRMCVSLSAWTSVYALWPFRMAIRVFDLVCPQAIFLVRVTWFPSGTIYVINIWPRCCNSTSLSRIERRSRWWKLNFAIINCFF